MINSFNGFNVWVNDLGVINTICNNIFKRLSICQDYPGEHHRPVASLLTTYHTTATRAGIQLATYDIIFTCSMDTHMHIILYPDEEYSI